MSSGSLMAVPEPNDGQRPHHAEAQHHIAGNGQDYQRRDHGQRDESHAEAGRVHHAVEGFFVDQKDEQPQQEAEQQRQSHVQQRHTGHILQKTRLKNILKGHGGSSFYVLAIHPAPGVFGKGGGLAALQLHQIPDEVR